jgi:hypothetical protein
MVSPRINRGKHSHGGVLTNDLTPVSVFSPHPERNGTGGERAEKTDRLGCNHYIDLFYII